MSLAVETCSLGYAVGGRSLVSGVSLGVEPGELVAVVGPNGAGKSTLVRLIAGDLEPGEGTIELFGRPVGSYDARELARCRAVLPQQALVGFAFTAREVVRMGRHPHRGRRRSVPDDPGCVDAALEAAAVAELADRRVTTLSGGEQTRVSLARVLAQDTPLLLLDEPTASLDVRHQELVMDVARNLTARDCTVIAVVHDLNLAAAHADRIAVLHRGELRTFASPWEALRPRLLRSVFDHALDVCPHPTRSCPLVVSSA